MTKKLIRRILPLLLIIFILNTLANRFFWYDSIWWFDMPMHFMGGSFVGLISFLSYIKWRSWRGVGTIKTRSVIFVPVVSALVVGFFWEIFELIVHLIYPLSQMMTFVDSVSDIFYDLSGGVIAAIYILYLSRVYKRADVNAETNV